MSMNDPDLQRVEPFVIALEAAMRAVPLAIRVAVAESLVAKIKDDQRPRSDKDFLEFDDIKFDPVEAGNKSDAELAAAAMAQILVRHITSENSAADAAKILFSHQRHGLGSGNLLEYLDPLIQAWRK